MGGGFFCLENPDGGEVLCFRKWVIPEKNHTIPRAAPWNSEGEGGFLDWNSKGTGG